MSDERRKSGPILTILARINPHTGAQLPALRPTKQDLSVLMPTFDPWVVALSFVARLQKAFTRHSQDFLVALTDITPIVGDCKLVHVTTGQEIVIEIKHQHCWIADPTDEDIAQWVYALSFRDRMIFTWKVERAYLFTTLNSKQALFIPRNQIPLSW